MPYQLPQKLPSAQVNVHYANLTALHEKTGSENRSPGYDELQPDLEPLMKHWSLIGKCSTFKAMHDILLEKTGLNLSMNTFSILVQKWNLTPPNGAGRGAAANRSTPRTAPRL